MIRVLLVGYCYGIRYERRLCQEVALHFAQRWFCKLDLDDKVLHHSTFSVNRLGRFRESEILRHMARRLMGTKRFLKSRDERKRVEMRFAHLKTHHGFERMRHRGVSGARDEFHLAAMVQNLKTMALRLLGPPTGRVRASTA
jgi:transposase